MSTPNSIHTHPYSVDGILAGVSVYIAFANGDKHWHANFDTSDQAHGEADKLSLHFGVPIVHYTAVINVATRTQPDSRAVLICSDSGVPVEVAIFDTWDDAARFRRALPEHAFDRVDILSAYKRADTFPWCDACESWHHVKNPTCRKRQIADACPVCRSPRLFTRTTISVSDLVTREHECADCGERFPTPQSTH